MKEPPAKPLTLEEWLWYVRRYENGIYVREQVEGHWTNVALVHLTPERWAYHVSGWLAEGRLPCRILEDHEIQHDGPESITTNQPNHDKTRKQS